MSACIMPPDDSDAETAPTIETLDDLLADEEYWADLVEAINRNFVSEVKASHADDGRRRSSSRKGNKRTRASG